MPGPQPYPKILGGPAPLRRLTDMPSTPRLLTALALLLPLGCGGKAEPARPSVVLILVDQLRWDAAEQWMPGTRALAEEGVRFDQMRSVAPWTYPSVISMFSGLYPQQHGADGNMRGNTMATFSEGVPLLPRFLRQAGYHTAGFVTNPFLHEWNPFHTTFDEFQAKPFINSAGNSSRGKGEFVWKKTMWADTVNPAVLKHYRSRPLDGPEFTYIHYIDVHGRRAGPARWEGAPFDGTYQASCRYVDERIVELYEYFHRRYEGELVFVVTSDHGENFGDDETAGPGPRKKKSTVHEFNLRIPCYVLPGKEVPAGVVIDEPTANLDLAPTLLEWTGLEVPRVMSGVSLLPAVRGGEYDGCSREIYAKMSYNGFRNDCLVHGGRKYLRHFDPRSGRLGVQRSYDLEADPRETTSLGDDFGALQGRLEEASGDHGYSLPAIFEDPEESLRDALHDLGYSGQESDSE